MPGLIKKIIFTAVFSLIAAFSLSSSAKAAEERNLPAAPAVEKATSAGGCFWCTESLFDKFPGVLSTTSGYTGGGVKNPTYEEVSSGTTGHAEALEVLFDPAKVSYAQLLDRFFRNIDPTAQDRQFNDTGTQYRTAVFYHNEEQMRLALEAKKELEDSNKFDKPIVTEISAAADFFAAEDYHQDYHEKNAVRYNLYNFLSGRDKFLSSVWGDEHQPAKSE